MIMCGCMCTCVHVEATGQSQVPHPKSHPPYFITKTSSLTSLEFANGQADCPRGPRDPSLHSPSAGSTSMCPYTRLFYMGTGGQLKPWYLCSKCFTIQTSFQPQALVRAAKGPFDRHRNHKLSSRLAIQFSLVYGFSWGK